MDFTVLDVILKVLGIIALLLYIITAGRTLR